MTSATICKSYMFLMHALGNHEGVEIHLACSSRTNVNALKLYQMLLAALFCNKVAINIRVKYE